MVVVDVDAGAAKLSRGSSRVGAGSGLATGSGGSTRTGVSRLGRAGSLGGSGASVVISERLPVMMTADTRGASSAKAML